MREPAPHARPSSRFRNRVSLTAARVGKELGERETELAEVLQDIQVQQAQAVEAAEHNSATARRIDDIKRELDQVRPCPRTALARTSLSRTNPFPAPPCASASSATGVGDGAGAATAGRSEPHARQPIRGADARRAEAGTRLTPPLGAAFYIAPSLSAGPALKSLQMRDAIVEESQFKQRLLEEIARDSASRLLSS